MEATRRVARTWRLVCQHGLERRLVATTRATGTEPTRALTHRARLSRACWAIPLSSLASEPHSAVVVMHEGLVQIPKGEARSAWFKRIMWRLRATSILSLLCDDGSLGRLLPYFVKHSY